MQVMASPDARQAGVARRRRLQRSAGYARPTLEAAGRRFTASAGAESSEERQIDRIADEVHGAVEKDDVHSAGMVAGGAVDLPRPRALADAVDVVHRVDVLLASAFRIRSAGVSVPLAC